MTRPTMTVERIAEEYRRDGYEVVIQPSAELLPSELRKFQPDILAHRQNERVLIEVKSRRQFAAESELSALAGRVGKLKGWRLEIQFVEPPRERDQQQAAPLSLEEATARLNSATLLLSQKDPGAALVVAWSAFEAVLRRLCWKADVPVVPWNGRRAAKQLLSIGLLSRSDYNLFMRGLEARNQVVHGATVGRSVRQTVHSVISTVRRLGGQSKIEPARRTR